MFKTVEKFEFDGKIHYPDHTEVNGKKFYSDKIVGKNGKARPLKNKKRVIDKIYTDGRFYIVPDYHENKNYFIDAEKGEVVGVYAPKLGVVRITNTEYLKNGIETFPPFLFDDFSEVFRMTPSDCAKKFTWDADLAAATYGCEFPSEKTVELRLKYPMNIGVEYQGLAKYHLEKKYWIFRPFKNGTILYKNFKITVKKLPKVIYAFNNDTITLEYDKYIVYIEIGKDTYSARKSVYNRWPMFAPADPDEYVKIVPR